MPTLIGGSLQGPTSLSPCLRPSCRLLANDCEHMLGATLNRLLSLAAPRLPHINVEAGLLAKTGHAPSSATRHHDAMAPKRLKHNRLSKHVHKLIHGSSFSGRSGHHLHIFGS